MIVYENEIFAISNGWIRGLRIHDKGNNSIIKVDRSLSTQCTMIWFEIRKQYAPVLKVTSRPDQQKKVQKIAEQMVFNDFGSIALRVENRDQASLFGCAPKIAAEGYINAATDYFLGGLKR